VTSALSHELRQLESWLQGLDAPALAEPLARARDRLRRDLLPRTVGGDQSLVIGIVGPNNSGKSALFNALVGQAASPSLPTGGATRRLVGAARAELLKTLENSSDWTRFNLRPFDPAQPGAAERALANAPDPSDLLVVASEAVPAGVLLIDTPDFDSIAKENRAASEALLAVADLAIVLVTKHSYQNAEVVDYLRRWLTQGRPWILVYNEAPASELVASHAAKLASDVGSPPAAIYAAPHDLAIMEGRAPLNPRRVGAPGNTSLAEGLNDLRHVEELKRAALAASLAQLAEDLTPIAEGLKAQSHAAAELLRRAEELCRRAGRRIAAQAMPAAPFLSAFRAVMDRRANVVSRGWRSGVRTVRGIVEAVPRALFGRRDPDEAGRLRGGLLSAERRELDATWPGFYEELARDLGGEARHSSRAHAPAALVKSLDRDLGPDSAQARARAHQEIERLPIDFVGFQEACEHLVLNAVEQRGFELDVQAGIDLATLLPVATAAGVMLTTGGLGGDLAAAGGGVLGSVLLERYTHLLGTGIVKQARAHWEAERGQLLAAALLRSALPQAGEQARRLAAQGASAALQLAAHQQSLLAHARREQQGKPATG
jgi:50S ribosome-binding GTPase